MKTEKILRYICFFILSVFIIFSFTSCNEDKWIPHVQGSNVSEIPFEIINDDYSVEKYTNYSMFLKSDWANFYFSTHAKAKDERYSKKFFKNSDLITIKFNKPEKGIKFTVTEVNISGNNCTVTLLPIKRIATTVKQDTTYCCFIETSHDVSGLNVELKFEETVLHESQTFSYITRNNEYHTFENRIEPMIFVINGKNGIEQFVEYDEIINKQSYIYRLLSNYSEDVFNDYSLLLVRLFSSDFENLAVNFKDDKLNIVGVYSNHYLFEKETPHHKLVALLIPKNLTINEISRTVYYEYEDNLEMKCTLNKFSPSGQSDINENVIMYSFTQNYD